MKETEGLLRSVRGLKFLTKMWYTDSIWPCRDIIRKTWFPLKKGHFILTYGSVSKILFTRRDVCSRCLCLRTKSIGCGRAHASQSKSKARNRQNKLNRYGNLTIVLVLPLHTSSVTHKLNSYYLVQTPSLDQCYTHDVRRFRKKNMVKSNRSLLSNKNESDWQLIVVQNDQN